MVDRWNDMHLGEAIEVRRHFDCLLCLRAFSQRILQRFSLPLKKFPNTRLCCNYNVDQSTIMILY